MQFLMGTECSQSNSPTDVIIIMSAEEAVTLNKELASGSCVSLIIIKEKINHTLLRIRDWRTSMGLGNPKP